MHDSPSNDTREAARDQGQEAENRVAEILEAITRQTDHRRPAWWAGWRWATQGEDRYEWTDFVVTGTDGEVLRLQVKRSEAGRREFRQRKAQFDPHERLLVACVVAGPQISDLSLRDAIRGSLQTLHARVKARLDNTRPRPAKAQGRRHTKRDEQAASERKVFDNELAEMIEAERVERASNR